MRRYQKRVDPNQADIVKHLIAMGCSVCKLDGVGGGVPDLLVGYHGRNVLIEVKCRDTDTGRGSGHCSVFEKEHGGLKPSQWRWHRAWSGQVAVAWSPEEAEEIVRAAATTIAPRPR